MKFAEHLTAHITPEWRKQYINYEEMKAMLYSACEQAPSAESVSGVAVKVEKLLNTVILPPTLLCLFIFFPTFPNVRGL